MCSYHVRLWKGTSIPYVKTTRCQSATFNKSNTTRWLKCWWLWPSESRFYVIQCTSTNNWAGVAISGLKTGGTDTNKVSINLPWMKKPLVMLGRKGKDKRESPWKLRLVLHLFTAWWLCQNGTQRTSRARYHYPYKNDLYSHRKNFDVRSDYESSRFRLYMPKRPMNRQISRVSLHVRWRQWLCVTSPGRQTTSKVGSSYIISLQTLSFTLSQLSWTSERGAYILKTEPRYVLVA